MENQNMLSSESEYNSLVDSIKEQARPKLGILLGIMMGIIGAVVWAVITIITGYNIGFVAIAVGFFVSVGFSRAGKDTNMIYGVIAGIIALLSILLGEAIISIYYISLYYELGFLEAIISIDYGVLAQIMFESFDAKTALFYFIAVSAAFRGSYINIDKAIAAHNSSNTAESTIEDSNTSVNKN